MVNLLLHDGFDNYTIGNTGTGLAANCFFNINNVWTYSGTTSLDLVAGAYGGYAARLSNSNIMYRALSATAGTVTVGFRIQPSSNILSQNNSSMRLLSGGSSGTTQIMLNILTSGVLQVTRGATIGTNVLGTSASSTIIGSGTYWIEVSVFRSATVGTLTVKVNGSAVITATGLNTGSADFDTLGLQGGGTSGVYLPYDDLYVIDSLTPLGEVRIEPLYPDANDSVTWNPFNTPYRMTALSGSSSQNTIGVASYIPTVGNWMVYIVNREVGTLPAIGAGWTLAASALDTVANQNSVFIYYRQIDDDFLNANTTNSSSAFLFSFSPFSGNFNGVIMSLEIPYDGLDLFLASVTSPVCQFSTTSGGISIPAVSTATEDLWMFTFVCHRASSGLAAPVLNGGYDTTSVNNGASARYAGFGAKAIASGGSFTPSVTFTGTGTTYYTLANLIVPRKYVVNYMAVNDHRIDGDLAYNYTTSTTDSDQFTLKNPSADPTTIHFVIPKTVARKDDAASRSITPNIVSGGTSGGSPVTTALTASYALQQGAAYALDPNTGSAWTYSAITSLKLKYTAGT